MTSDRQSPRRRFSANLGFLWTDRALPDAVRAAASHGFDAVELHWPYDTPPEVLRAALHETGLPLLGLNTRPGDLAAGEFGLAALPGREDEARAGIDEALAYARTTGAGAVHVMAGKAQGAEAMETFCAALSHACAAAGDDITILIEPLNPHDVPGYLLGDTGAALKVIARVGAGNLRLMFDCYHVARAEGDVIARLEACFPALGHVQFAGVPRRGPPDSGDLDYRAVFDTLDRLGWDRPLGAEYRPDGPTEHSLEWMEILR